MWLFPSGWPVPKYRIPSYARNSSMSESEQSLRAQISSRSRPYMPKGRWPFL